MQIKRSELQQLIKEAVVVERKKKFIQEMVGKYNAGLLNEEEFEEGLFGGLKSLATGIGRGVASGVKAVGAAGKEVGSAVKSAVVDASGKAVNLYRQGAAIQDLKKYATVVRKVQTDLGNLQKAPELQNVSITLPGGKSQKIADMFTTASNLATAIDVLGATYEQSMKEQPGTAPPAGAPTAEDDEE